MSDFTPVPGVWYVDRSYIDADLDIWYLYAPHRPGTDEATYPWWSNDTLEWEKEAPVDRLEVLHNPHPPTRTEWLVLDGDEQWSAFDDYETARQQVDSYDGSFSEDHIRLGKRQVTETEWQEVTDV